MKLSEIKGEQALDLWADLLEPISEIASDKEIAKAVKAGDVKIAEVASKIMKRHKKSIIAILALIEGEDKKIFEEKITAFTLPSKVLALLNDKELMNLFLSQSLTEDARSSASALGNTEEV